MTCCSCRYIHYRSCHYLMAPMLVNYISQGLNSYENGKTFDLRNGSFKKRIETLVIGNLNCSAAALFVLWILNLLQSYTFSSQSVSQKHQIHFRKEKNTSFPGLYYWMQHSGFKQFHLGHTHIIFRMESSHLTRSVKYIAHSDPIQGIVIQPVIFG